MMLSLAAFPRVGGSSMAANYLAAQRKHVEVKKQHLWYPPERSLQIGSGGLGSPQQLEKVKVVSSDKWFHNAAYAT